MSYREGGVQVEMKCEGGGREKGKRGDGGKGKIWEMGNFVC